MHGFTQIIETLRTEPFAWAVLGLFAARALYSVVAFLKCPVLHGKINITPEKAHEAVHARMRHSWRFLVLMALGILLAVVGLYKLAAGAAGGLALFLLVTGVFLFLTEPVRHRLSDAEMRVIASRLVGGESVARSDLRATYREMVGLEVGIVASLALVLALL